MNFKTFESLGPKGVPTDPVYIREPQGKLRRSADVKVWSKVGVGKSDVADRGVFAVDVIEKGETFEVAPVLIVDAEHVKESPFIDYAFKIDDGKYAIAFGNVSLYNHRNQPSATWKLDPLKGTIALTALRDIQPGEEIFISYGKAYWKTRDVSMETSPTQEQIKKTTS